MKLIFMGSPTFAVPSLRALVAAGHEIVAVYTQPPRPAGRGRALTPTAVHDEAVTLGLGHLVRHPERLRGDALEQLLATPCDAMCVVAYGQILSQAVLDHAPCLNVHFSALPRWRGAAPVQHAIMAGDTTIEATVARMVLALDSGPVYLRKEFPIADTATSGEIYRLLADEGAPMLADTVAHLHDWTAVPQPEEGVTLAPKITAAMRQVDWLRTAQEIHNQVRALAPAPGAMAEVGGETIKLLATRVAEGRGTPGQILRADDVLEVACGTGSLQVLRLQRAGKKAMDAGEALRGWAVEATV